MLRIALVTAAVLAVGLGGTVAAGRFRWRGATRDLVDRLELSRMPLTPTRYDPAELDGLPPPVQRFFDAVLTSAQPMVAAVTLEHAGTFNMSETGERWRPFTSAQRVATRRPGFVWDARVRVAPGLGVRVHDAYVAGEGVLRAALFGLVPVVDLRDTPGLAEGEFLRWFAETAWYPTALLPSQGVEWAAVDDRSARATLRDGDITLTLLFRFDDAGLVESVRAETRPRTVDGTIIPTPWEGRWRRYERRDGMLVPLEGEVAWILPSGPHPYWRGRITRAVYEFAR